MCRKRLATGTTSASNSAPASAPATTRSPISPSKVFLSDRKVESGKNIDFRFFEKEGFSIRSKIKDQGWKFYCSLKENTYVDLAREFYLNLGYSNEIIKSTVKGVDISLDPVLLGEILHLPCEGYTNMKLSVKEEGINIILGRTFTGSLNKLEAKFLSIEMRLLHHMVTIGYKIPSAEVLRGLTLPRLLRLSTADGISPDFSNSRIPTVLIEFSRRTNSHYTTRAPST